MDNEQDMTSDTIHRMANAIVHFSNPFEMAVDEVLSEPIFRSPRRSRRDAMKKHFNVRGRQILRDYDAALAGGGVVDKQKGLHLCSLQMKLKMHTIFPIIMER